MKKDASIALLFCFFAGWGFYDLIHDILSFAHVFQHIVPHMCHGID